MHYMHYIHYIHYIHYMHCRYCRFSASLAKAKVCKMISGMAGTPPVNIASLSCSRMALYAGENRKSFSGSLV